jgi:RNA polymerase sigma-70 factor (ECF subfamily)
MEPRALIDSLAGERARFVRLARSRVATEADAEDVVQRAMMRAAERAAQIADASRARAWFYRILRRAIVDHHRQEPREREVADVTEVTAEAPDHPEPAADAGGPRGPTCRCAVRMLGQLRPAYAEAVRRVDFEEEDPRAVAGALGLSMANLYVRVHRGRRALRERVEGHCGVSSIGPCLECTCSAHDRCGS